VIDVAVSSTFPRLHGQFASEAQLQPGFTTGFEKGNAMKAHDASVSCRNHGILSRFP
jgi:hypothetical protein